MVSRFPVRQVKRGNFRWKKRARASQEGVERYGEFGEFLWKVEMAGALRHWGLAGSGIWYFGRLGWLQKNGLW